MDEPDHQALGTPNWTATSQSAQNVPYGGAGPVVTTDSKVAKVDHLTEIAELASGLHNVSPSGAETVRDKILQHIAWIREPKSYDEHMAREKKAHDEAAAASKKAKEAANKAA